jgi:enolase
MIMSVGANNFREGMRMASEVYRALQKILKDKHGPGAVNAGDEGGFGDPELSGEIEALDCVVEVIKNVKIATDLAASDFYNKEEKV